MGPALLPRSSGLVNSPAPRPLLLLLLLQVRLASKMNDDVQAILQSMTRETSHLRHKISTMDRGAAPPSRQPSSGRTYSGGAAAANAALGPDHSGRRAASPTAAAAAASFRNSYDKLTAAMSSQRQAYAEANRPSRLPSGASTGRGAGGAGTLRSGSPGWVPSGAGLPPSAAHGNAGSSLPTMFSCTTTATTAAAAPGLPSAANGTDSTTTELGAMLDSFRRQASHLKGALEGIVSEPTSTHSGTSLGGGIYGAGKGGSRRPPPSSTFTTTAAGGGGAFDGSDTSGLAASAAQLQATLDAMQRSSSKFNSLTHPSAAAAAGGGVGPPVITTFGSAASPSAGAPALRPTSSYRPPTAPSRSHSVVVTTGHTLPPSASAPSLQTVSDRLHSAAAGGSTAATYERSHPPATSLSSINSRMSPAFGPGTSGHSGGVAGRGLAARRMSGSSSSVSGLEHAPSAPPLLFEPHHESPFATQEVQARRITISHPATGRSSPKHFDLQPSVDDMVYSLNAAASNAQPPHPSGSGAADSSPFRHRPSSHYRHSAESSSLLPQRFSAGGGGGPPSAGTSSISGLSTLATSDALPSAPPLRG